MTFGLFLVALAIILHAHMIRKVLLMALDRTQLDAGLQAVADGLTALAAAIANPAGSLTEAQAALDDTGAKLQDFALALTDLKAAEDAEDGTTATEAQPEE